MGLYRGQSPESRKLHHPYPFDRPRLTLLFIGMLVSQRLVHRGVRYWPNASFVVLVAEGRPGGPLLGLATIHFVRHPPEPTWARFGYLVADEFRGQRIGSRLAIELYRTALDLGVERGGGTILAPNTVSTHLVERFGFDMRPTPEVDTQAPGVTNLAAVEDLRAVMARVRSLRDDVTGLTTPRDGPADET